MESTFAVEDEEHLKMGIANFIEEGYRVTVSGDAAGVIKLLMESQADIDLVVPDPMLPGHERLRRLRISVSTQSGDAGAHSEARTLSEDRTRGFDVGANQYMSKPFDWTNSLAA